MDFSFRHRQVGGLYFKYSLLFIILAGAFFGGYFLTGHTLIWNADALNQHLPLMAQWRQMVLAWLHHPGRSLTQWSWQMGLGTDTFQVFSYYTLGDVFAYLSLLFPAAKLTLAYQVIIIIRVYCVGLAFCYLAQHLPFTDRVILAGAAVYLVNSYLLYAAIAQPMFTTTFILFPLIVVQIERVLQGECLALDGSLYVDVGGQLLPGLCAGGRGAHLPRFPGGDPLPTPLGLATDPA